LSFFLFFFFVAIFVFFFVLRLVGKKNEEANELKYNNNHVQM